MIVRFPDTLTVNVPQTFAFAPDSGTTPPTLKFFNNASYSGGAATMAYANFNLAEQARHIVEMNLALARNLPYLDLTSDAPLPTGTDSDAAPKDMFPDAAIGGAAPYTVVKNQLVMLHIGNNNTDPIGPATAGQAKALVASFQPNCAVELISGGGTSYIVFPTVYVDATRLWLTMPDAPTGDYDLKYTDSRGNVTKAGAFHYA